MIIMLHQNLGQIDQNLHSRVIYDVICKRPVRAKVYVFSVL